jgi:hypothetical protein
LENAQVETATNAVVVNGGKPINLRYGSLNDEMSDFMFADILAAVVEGSQIATPGIRKLSDVWQEEIARWWERHYL